MQTINYKFDMFCGDMDRLAQQIKHSGEDYECIVGIARGGLVPATVLSHQLNIPLLPLVWQTRETQIKQDLMEVKRIIQQGGKILFVDDMIDSGQTFNEIRRELDADCESTNTAVIFYNPDQPVKPDFFARILDRRIDQRWVVFWWEQLPLF